MCEGKCELRKGVTPTRRPKGDAIGILLPNNQRQYRTLHIQKDVLLLDVLPYELCQLLRPVSATHASIFRMDPISTSYAFPALFNPLATAAPAALSSPAARIFGFRLST